MQNGAAEVAVLVVVYRDGSGEDGEFAGGGIPDGSACAGGDQELPPYGATRQQCAHSYLAGRMTPGDAEARRGDGP